VDQPSSRAVGFGLVAALADACNGIQRIDHLMIEAPTFRHWWPPW
jgi:hypothetical protein